jgi:hypothetical protein
MPLARLAAPFDHPDFIFEPKMDSFRAIAYVEAGACRLVSRNGNSSLSLFFTENSRCCLVKNLSVILIPSQSLHAKTGWKNGQFGKSIFTVP